MRYTYKINQNNKLEVTFIHGTEADEMFLRGVIALFEKMDDHIGVFKEHADYWMREAGVKRSRNDGDESIQKLQPTSQD